MAKTMVKKVFVNKRNNQMTVVLSKKQMKKSNPTIKFGKNLFVRLEVFNKKRK